MPEALTLGTSRKKGSFYDRSETPQFHWTFGARVQRYNRGPHDFWRNVGVRTKSPHSIAPRIRILPLSHGTGEQGTMNPLALLEIFTLS